MSPDEKQFDADRIETLLSELGRRCSAKGFEVEMFVVCGSAMAMAYSRSRVTRDIDAIFEPKTLVYKEAALMAEEHGLPAGWLNDGAKGFLPDRRRDEAPRTLFSRPGIAVSVASAEYMFAMKAAAARVDADQEDLATLAGHLRLRDADEALRIVEKYYRPQSLPAKVAFFVEAVFEDLATKNRTRATRGGPGSNQYQRKPPRPR